MQMNQQKMISKFLLAASISGFCVSHPLYAGFTLFERRASITDSYIAEAKLQYDKAIEALMPTYQLDTNSYFLNLRLGWLFYIKGPLKNAETHYLKAIEIKPQSVEARLGLFKVYTAQSQHDLALEAAKKTLSIDPLNYTAHLQAVSAALALQNTKEALEIIESLRRSYPVDQGVLEQRCLILFKLPEQRTSALEAFRELITIYPQSPVITQGMVQMELEKNLTK